MAQYRRKSQFRAKRAKRAPRKATNFGAQAITALKGYALQKLKQKLGLNTESKFSDVTGAATVSTTLTQRIASPTIAQGLTVGTRTGASIRISKVETRIALYAPAAATAPCNVRIIQIRYTHGGNPLVGDILEVTTEMSSPINNEASSNGISILKDVVVPVGTATGGDGAQYIEWTHTGLTDHMIWPDADTTGLPASTVKGNIATYWFCDNLTTSPVVTAKSRYWFVDN